MTEQRRRGRRQSRDFTSTDAVLQCLAPTLAAALLTFGLVGCSDSSSGTGEADGAGGIDVSGPNSLVSTVDLGVVMEINDTGSVRTVDTVTGVVVPFDKPRGELFPQPATAETVVVAFSNGVRSETRVLDRSMRELNLLTYPADLAFGRTFVSPDGQLLLNRDRDPTVRVWTMAGELVERLPYERAYVPFEAGWMHGNRVLLPREDRQGLLVGPPGGVGSDFTTLDLPPSVNGVIHDFDGSPSSERIAMIVRARDEQGNIVNSVRVVDLDTLRMHTVASTPGYPGSSNDPYTDAHRIHHAFWHHEGEGLFVLVGSTPDLLAPPPDPTLFPQSSEPLRLYFVESADAEGLIIDNSNLANTSTSIALIPREPDMGTGLTWVGTKLADYFSLTR